MEKHRQNSRINEKERSRGGNKIVRIRGIKNKPTLSVTERLQRANAELTELQKTVKAKGAETERLKREEKSKAQQIIMKTIKEGGKTAEEVLAMTQRQ